MILVGLAGSVDRFLNQKVVPGIVIFPPPLRKKAPGEKNIAPFWVHFGSILVTFWVHFGSLDVFGARGGSGSRPCRNTPKCPAPFGSILGSFFE